MKKILWFFLGSSLMAIVGSMLFVNGIKEAGYFFLGISLLFILLTVGQVVKFLFAKS